MTKKSAQFDNAQTARKDKSPNATEKGKASIHALLPLSLSLKRIISKMSKTQRTNVYYGLSEINLCVIAMPSITHLIQKDMRRYYRDGLLKLIFLWDIIHFAVEGITC